MIGMCQKNGEKVNCPAGGCNGICRAKMNRRQSIKTTALAGAAMAVGLKPGISQGFNGPNPSAFLDKSTLNNERATKVYAEN